jgi:hypothetical protein
MKIFKAWRYKCDFCGKNKHQKTAMEKHELHCTMNPNRVCKFHKYATGEENPTVPSIASMLILLESHKSDTDYGLKALREATDNCPCCILAALRQSGLTSPVEHYDGGDELTINTTYLSDPLVGKDEFDFKKELEDFWAEERSMQQQRNIDQGCFERSYY